MPRFYSSNILRSYDIAVGQIFSNFYCLHYDKVTKEQIQEIRVPLMLGNKLHWYLRKYDTIPRTFNVKTVLPRISFTRGAPQYDEKRQMNKFTHIKGNKKYSSITQNYIQRWAGTAVPYKIPYNFNIWTKNETEMNQLLEQILALFNTQSYNVFINEIPLLEVGRMCRLIIENSVQNYQTEYDIKGDRLLRYSFNLTLEGNIYPVIHEQTVIKEIYANYWEVEEDEAKLIERVIITEDSDEPIAITIANTYNSDPEMDEEFEVSGTSTSEEVTITLTYENGEVSYVVTVLDGAYSKTDCSLTEADGFVVGEEVSISVEDINSPSSYVEEVDVITIKYFDSGKLLLETDGKFLLESGEALSVITRRD